MMLNFNSYQIKHISSTQQLYVMRKAEKKVVHIELQQATTPQKANPFHNGKRTPSRGLSNPFHGATTRTSFYTLNDQNNCLSNSIKNAQHTQTNKSRQLKKRRISSQNCYVRLTKSVAHSTIFTQPIYKLEKRQTQRQPRRSTQFNQFYDQISAFNKKLITKQYQFDQKVPYTPIKARVVHSRNLSSINTQSSRLQTQKSQNFEPLLKPKPWELRKIGFNLLTINKKTKAAHQKVLQRCHIDAWEIFDREDPQY